MAAAATVHDRGPDCGKLFPIFCTMLAIAAFILSMAGMSYIVFYGPSTPIYSVAIDSASGLDLPTTRDDLAGLEPRFNLTLRVTSESLGVGGCVEAGTFLEVSYRCNMLAASAATSEQLCAEPTESREVSFVARGTDVRLPGYVMDNLVADMRNGVHAFEVTVRRSDSDYDDVMLVSCGGRQVGGDASAALETQCHASHFCPHRDRGRSVVARSSSPKHISSLSMIM